MRDYYNAISDFGDAIRIEQVNGDDYLATNYENRGDAYLKVRDSQRAVDDYTEAIKTRVESQIILWSLRQFRDLYPEFKKISDDVLLTSFMIATFLAGNTRSSQAFSLTKTANGKSLY